MISVYHFGSMTIVEKTYASDLIIFPDGRVEASWWRKTGHQLCEDDLKAVIAAEPEVIIAGTGDPGLMKPVSGLVDSLRACEIDLICLPTTDAVREFNRRFSDGVTAGCFHLTC